MSSNKIYGGTGAASGRRRRQIGLTLIELLVAISVLAFVAVLGWRGLDSIVRARIALNEDLEQTRGMQLTFAQMQNDFSQMVTQSSVPDRAPLVIDQNRISMIRNVHAENQPTRVQVVTYQVKNGVLMRRESAATRDLVELNNLWTAAENGADTDQDVALQSGVASLTMRLWNGTSWGEANTNPEAPEEGRKSGRLVSRREQPDRPGSEARPEAGAGTGAPQPAQTTSQPAMTGLQVALQLNGRDTGMLKVFLLGAV